MDCVSLSHRPRKGYIKPLRCLNIKIPVFNDISLTVLNFQLDNQMYRKGLYDFPAIVSGQNLGPLQKFKFNKCLVSDYMLETLKENSLICLNFEFDSNSDVGNVLKSAHMTIKPLNVYIEDSFAYKINSILSSFVFTDNTGRAAEHPYYSKTPQDVSISSQNLSRQLCLDSLKIDEISVLVSVHASMKMYIGLDQSPLHFSSFERKNFITTSYALGKSAKLLNIPKMAV